MRRFAPFTLTLAAVLLAACSGPSATMPAVTVTDVSPSQLSADTDSFVIEGANFFQYVGGRGTRVEFCGVSVAAELIDPTTRTITLAPAGRVSVEAGERVVVGVPADGLVPGISNLRIVRPDGSVTVVEDAITCVGAPTEEPQPNRAPIAGIHMADQQFGAQERIVTYVSTSTDPDGDELTYTWEAWSLPPISEGGSQLEQVEGEVDGAEFVITRPEADFHFLRLTVTDPAGLTDSVLFATILDPLGDIVGGNDLVPQQVGELSEEPPIDLVRVSWTPDAARDTTIFELEAASDFTLPTAAQGYCSEITPTQLSVAPALEPQQAAGSPTLLGILFFYPGLDFENPAAYDGVMDPLVLVLHAPNEDGSFNLFSFANGDPCDPTTALARVTASVEDGVLRLGIPSSIVGVESLMVSAVGSDSTITDVAPEYFPFMPQVN